MDLLDFDNDGSKELYVVYEISGETVNGFPLYREGVWTEQSDEPYSLMTKDHTDLGVVMDGAMFVTTDSDGKAYINETEEKSDGNTTTIIDFLWTRWIHN